MIFFVLVLLLVIISGAHYSKPNEFNTDYISKDGIAPIKGIFVILILFSHGRGYFTLEGVYDEMYLSVQGHLDQMVIAMFLFYSGYGIMEQIKKRGFDYVKSIPQKRFPHLLLIFDIAVVFYMILYVALGNKLSLKTALLALTGWQGILNSSWYIFVTFVLYIFTFIGFFAIKWIKDNRFKLVCIVAVTVLSFGLILVFMRYTEKERFWYDTLILYSLGLWYSYFKPYIEKVTMKNDVLYYVLFTVVLSAYIYFYNNKSVASVNYEIWAVLFTLGIVMITMKVRIESRLLSWFGDHIFSIYILQRIPMVILRELGFADRHKYFFMILSIAITVAIAAVYDDLTGRLTKLIWKPKKQIN